jgi:phosphotransferase system HPr (HPr) family protein
MEETKVSRKVTVALPNGVHLRVVSAIVETLRAYDAEVEISGHSQTADARHALQLMTLCAEFGTELTLIAKGADSEAALDALERLLQPEVRESS